MKTVEQFIQEYVDQACETDELAFISEEDAKLLDNFNTFLSLLQSLILHSELEVESIERRALLRLFEISSQALSIAVRNQQEDAQQISEVLEAIFQHALDNQINEQNTALSESWSLIEILTSAGFKLSESTIRAVLNLQKPDMQELSEEQRYENALQAMKLALRDASIDSDIGFYELYKNEFAALPEGAEHYIFSLLSHQGKPWAIDAILLFLLHPEAKVKHAVLEAINKISPSELSNTARLKRLICIRNLSPTKHKTALDPLIRSVLRANKDINHGRQYAQLTEIYCSLSDCFGSHSFLIFSEDFLWGGILKHSAGIVDDFYIEQLSAEQKQEIVQKMAEQYPMYQVTEAFLAEVLPWFIAKSVENNGISPSGLLFFEKVPLHFSQAQPIELEERLEQLLADLPSEAELIESNSSSHELINDFPSIKHWLLAEQATPYQNEAEVLQALVEDNEHDWAERFIITALIAQYSSKHIDAFHAYPGSQLSLRTETRADCLLSAYALLHKPLNSISLLKTLAQHALKTLEHEGKAKAEPCSYQLHISLSDSSPLIWRRLKVNANISLSELHQVIQIAMGWQAKGNYYFIRNASLITGSSEQSNIPQLRDVLTEETEPLEYIYKDEAHWHHCIKLEKVQNKDLKHPTVSTGKNACPPEDIEGIKAYRHYCRDLKKIIKEQGPDDSLFDPKAFNKATINQQLKQFGENK